MGLHNYNIDKEKEIKELEAFKTAQANQAAETAAWRSLFESEKEKGGNKLLNAYNKNYPSTTDTINQYGSQQFSYNPETDANYQAYLKLARENAGLAMQDTVAKASAMTGGYSNSNAQLAGQKVYNQHLSEAEGRVGDYYAMALNAFNTNQDTLLNKINLAWQQEDRDIAAQNRLRALQLETQDRLRENALLKAEYGDYSGLTDLGISEEAVNKYKENADWATQYSKDQAAFERAWQVAEATGDYTTLYKQLGYTDEQIAEFQGSIDDKKYNALPFTEKDVDVANNFVDLLTNFVTSIMGYYGSIEDFVVATVNGTTKKDANIEKILNSTFLVDSRTNTKYTLNETINELKSEGLTAPSIADFVMGALEYYAKNR